MNAVVENMTGEIERQMQEMGRRARAASRALARAETGAKNAALMAMASIIEDRAGALMAENRKDLAAGEQNGLDAALLDRLAFTPERIAVMAEGLRRMIRKDFLPQRTQRSQS